MAKRQAGLTLVELLVAVTVLALATVMALTLYDAARDSYKIGQNVTEQQQTVRIAFDLMTQDLRMAGFNADPDGDPGRPDEQIEGAFPTAVVIRADFDADDPAAATDPEATLATGAYAVVTTGNDEIRSYALEKPDGSSAERLTVEADVTPAARDGVVQTIDVDGLALTQGDPPYTLYRYSFNNDPGTFGSAAFVNKTVMAENVRSLRFRYFDQAGSEIAAPGGADTTAQIRARRAIHSVRVELEVLTRDPDPDWEDVDDPNPTTRRFRKFLLASQVTPRNLRRRGVPDLVADVSPPEPPSSPQLFPGHCEGLYIDWDASTEPDLAYYRILLGTDPFALHQVRYSENPGYYLDGLTDGTSYHVSIQAVDDSGNPSALSPTTQVDTDDTTVPRQAANVGASEDEQHRIRIQWDAVLENAAGLVGDPDSPRVRDLAGYRLYRGTRSGFWTSSSNLRAGESVLWAMESPEFTDDQVVNCQPYFYRVRAVDRCGVQASASAEVSGVAYSTVKPQAPANLTAHFSGIDRVRINWQEVSLDENGDPVFIERYNIYRSAVVPVGVTPAVPGDYTYRATHDINDGPDFEETVVVPDGQTVWYLVRATDECSPANESAPSVPAQPVCEFSGEIQFFTPANGATVSGSTLVRVLVSFGSGTYETLRLRFESGVDGSIHEETINQVATQWDYIWETSNQPPFVPGPYTITAEVDQRIDASTVCTDVRSIDVVLGGGYGD